MAEVPATRQRQWFDTVGLRRDLRAAALDATVALVLTLVIFAWFYQRVQSGSAPGLAARLHGASGEMAPDH